MGLDEHLSGLLAAVQPLEPLDISLNEALGCQVVGDVTAETASPHYDQCAITGYAVRAADLPAGLTVIDEVAPGFAASQPVYAGVAIRVAAGTALPGGADAVVPGPALAVGQTCELAGPVAPGTGVVPAGAYAAAGDVMVPSGTLVTPATVGLLASLGRQRISVRPQPRVVVVTVGDALVSPGTPATSGLVFDAAGPMLCAAAETHGAVAYLVAGVATEPRAVAQAMDDQLIRADLLIVVGDTAAPDSTLRTQLAALGEVSFDEGSTNLGPFGHGVAGEERVPVLALPGDPPAAALLFALLAVPMIHAMRGVPFPPARQVRLAREIPRGTALQLLAVRVDNGQAEPVARDRLTLADLVAADMVVRILPGTGQQARGSAVPATPLQVRRS